MEEKFMKEALKEARESFWQRRGACWCGNCER